VCSIPPGLAYWDGVSDVRLVIQYICFTWRCLLFKYCRAIVGVARWIHLFCVRFIYIDELLAGLMFPHLLITCIAHVIGRFIKSIGSRGALWKQSSSLQFQVLAHIHYSSTILLIFIFLVNWWFCWFQLVNLIMSPILVSRISTMYCVLIIVFLEYPGVVSWHSWWTCCAKAIKDVVMACMGSVLLHI
jgi:hypothetical protein